MKKKKITILLAGGGSGGPVSPLLAVKKHILELRPDVNFDFVFVGTKNGPERQMVNSLVAHYETVPAAKLRRYFSLLNFLLPIIFILAIIKSFYLVLKYRPKIIFGAGSFVQVPLMYCGKLFGAKIYLHQQDVEVSLSNYLCSFIAKRITLSFKESEKGFPDSLFLSGLSSKSRTVFTGNPCNIDSFPQRKDALKNLGLESDLPVVLVFGGGTGAIFLNRLVEESIPELTKYVQILHATGSNKGGGFNKEYPHYHRYEFITDMPSAYAASDIVVSRAGLSTITELSYAGKVSIIVPMPETHQEANAEIMSYQKSALVVSQDALDSENFIMLIRKLCFSGKLQNTLSSNISKLMPKDSSEKIARVLLESIRKS